MDKIIQNYNMLNIYIYVYYACSSVYKCICIYPKLKFVIVNTQFI